MSRRFAFVLSAVIAVYGGQAQAFGPKGHQTVGAIADQRIASLPVAEKIHELLDGLTLEQAATLPDEIKSWDKTPPTEPHAFHVHGHPAIDMDLIAFWTAHNKRANRDYHRNFHFVDIPVGGNAKYRDGELGRSDYDLVQMIPACVRVLRANKTDANLAITPRVAVILLAHYVGDIAQPLHVGAQYFDPTGKPVVPVAGQKVLSDVGGNNLMLILNSESERGFGSTSTNLHSWWDDDAVEVAYEIVKAEIMKSNMAPSGPLTDMNVKKYLALKEPANWKMPTGVGLEEYAEQWANEILPFANQAHDRLAFQNMVVHGTSVNGFAREKNPQPNGQTYSDWAAGVVRVSMHKAGWRLADLLDQALSVNKPQP